MNRSHVAQVLVLFRMVCKLAIETVTFTTGMFVQPPTPFFVIVQLHLTVGTEQHGVTHGGALSSSFGLVNLHAFRGMARSIACITHHCG